MNSWNNGTVWVFNGESAQFPGGVFPSRADAEIWIVSHKLSGVLTEYPLGVGIYDWAIKNGFFSPKRPEHQTPKFIGKFTSDRQQHVHYEEGLAVT